MDEIEGRSRAVAVLEDADGILELEVQGRVDEPGQEPGSPGKAGGDGWSVYGAVRGIARVGEIPGRQAVLELGYVLRGDGKGRRDIADREADSEIVEGQRSAEVHRRAEKGVGIDAGHHRVGIILVLHEVREGEIAMTGAEEPHAVEGPQIAAHAEEEIAELNGKAQADDGRGLGIGMYDAASGIIAFDVFVVGGEETEAETLAREAEAEREAAARTAVVAHEAQGLAGQGTGIA